MRREHAAGRIRRGMRGREMDGVNYFTRVFRGVGDDDDVKTDGAGVESEKTDFNGCVCVCFTDCAEEVGKASVDEPWSPGSHSHAR